MHAENLVPMIQAVCRYAATKIDTIDVVAVSMGPGSYTGLRIGSSTAKGLAMATDASLIGVPTLEAWVASASGVALMGPRSTVDSSPQQSSLFVAATPARETEVFVAVFRRTADGHSCVLATTATEVDSLPDQIRPLLGADEPVIVVGDSSAGVAKRLADARLPATAAPASLTAETIARLGYSRAIRGEIEDLATFEPLYSKQFVAKRPRTSIFERLNV